MSSLTATAQEACPCVPVTHLWTATTCDTWDCAAAALAVAAGDPFTFAYPSGSGEHPWIVVRRIVAGSAGDSGNDPFSIETFDTMDAATQRYAAIDHELQPLLMTAPDGHVLVMSLRDRPVRRRAGGR